MNHTPFDRVAALHIGTVQYVAPDKIEVALDSEAPASVALNAGEPQHFPRVSGYVLVAVDGGYLIGQIEWVTIELAKYPKRTGVSDFGIIDLPFPSRKMQIMPAGTLLQKNNQGQENKQNYVLDNGITAFPSVGADVLMPTNEQLKAIVQSGENSGVKIGTCPLCDNADVHVDPNRLFGGHLAILGNTGSGKSCSVAGLVRWSIDAANRETKNDSTKGGNARFIILDFNGEYKEAFKSLEKVKVFSVSPDKGEKQLQVPIGMWNDEEWCAFTRTSPGVQKPVLIDTLAAIRKSLSSSKDNDNVVSCFSLAEFNKQIDIRKDDEKNPYNKGHVETLKMRINSLLSDHRMKRIIDNKEKPTLHSWLSDYVWEEHDDNKAQNAPSVTVIDLSLVPSEVIHIVITVTTRVILEALQRYREQHKGSLPVVLVAEEAHSFIKRYREDAEDESAAILCCRSFEKAAREGRKFGLGLVISSQRPSELSATVLSQCNSFLVHRISNDYDQEMIKRLVPGNLRGLFRRLPSLPSQNAILLGWASSVPTLVKIKNLIREEQPSSNNPDFWGMWTEKTKIIQWKNVAAKWLTDMIGK